MAIPQPGMIGLTSISGRVGKAIELGQWLNGEGFATWEHAFVLLPGNQILEAEPGGALIRELHYSDVYWCEGIYNLLPPENNIPLGIVAEGLKGIKYSFLDYGALSAHRLHIPAPNLRGYISSTGHMICSQMCDEFYLRLGAHIFTDDRWNGDVTPASLYRRDLQLR
jgi:hypothetical protein